MGICLSYPKYSEVCFTDGCEVRCPLLRSDIKGMITRQISPERVFIFHEIFPIDMLNFDHVRCLLKSPCGMKPLPIGKHLPHISACSSSLSEASLYWPSITSNVAQSSIRITREYLLLREGNSPTRVRPREFL